MEGEQTYSIEYSEKMYVECPHDYIEKCKNQRNISRKWKIGIKSNSKRKSYILSKNVII
jgi:hypothetical protein